MSQDEPGSSKPIDNIPMAKQALAQKRDVRDLNTRLEMYVRAQAEKTRNVNQLKNQLAKQEMELNAKIKQQQLQFQDNIEKLRKENENLAYDNKCTHQDLTNATFSKKELEDRLLSSEEKNAALTSECGNFRVDLNRHKQELDALRKEYASIKYKYESYESERSSFEDRMNKQKIKNEQLLREVTQKETNLKAEKETFSRVIIEKNDEISKLRNGIDRLEHENNTTQTRLRKEFDNKLAEFVRKREDQYKQEKDEWMRIFKEEFNRKLRSFKEANQELSHSNIKQSEEITDLRTRISKLKQQKTELEVTNRGNEEENEKLRNDLDDLRRTKDNEIKHKNAMILQERDRFKAKELQFDELAGIKLQLDSEIELYRNILNEAEQECGYQSPLSAMSNKNSRKRKRFNNMTPMGPIAALPIKQIKEVVVANSNSNNSNNSMNCEAVKIITPGIARAAAIAEKDLKSFQSDGDISDTEMKDEEDTFDTYTTPIGIEGGSLQFSGLDLNKGMIEIQNMGETAIELDGYSLANQTGDMQYELPNKTVLSSKDTLRIYVGQQMYKEICEDGANGNNKGRKLVGDYEGGYVFWGCDVWTGNHDDCARLYNPSQEEIARIEISPDMVDKNNKKGGCLTM